MVILGFGVNVIVLPWCGKGNAAHLGVKNEECHALEKAAQEEHGADPSSPMRGGFGIPNDADPHGCHGEESKAHGQESKGPSRPKG